MGDRGRRASSSCSRGRSRRSRRGARRVRPCASGRTRRGDGATARLGAGRCAGYRRRAGARPPRRSTTRSSLLAGEVLVAPMTTPDWVPTMRRAAALVTDGGGVTCHAAIVSRELACAVRRRHATRNRSAPRRRARDGRRRGRCRLRRRRHVVADRCRGSCRRLGPWPRPAPVALGTRALREPRHRRPRRGGRGAPGRRRRAAARRVHDRRRARRRAPAPAARRGGREEFCRAMAGSLLRITRAFAPRPVVYRTIDFRSRTSSATSRAATSTSRSRRTR